MLFGAREIVVVGRQRPVGVFNAKQTGVPLVADAGGYAEVIELLVLPVRALILKSRYEQRNNFGIMLQLSNYPSIV